MRPSGPFVPENTTRPRAGATTVRAEVGRDVEARVELRAAGERRDAVAVARRDVAVRRPDRGRRGEPLALALEALEQIEQRELARRHLAGELARARLHASERGRVHAARRACADGAELASSSSAPARAAPRPRPGSRHRQLVATALARRDPARAPRASRRAGSRSRAPCARARAAARARCARPPTSLPSADSSLPWRVRFRAQRRRPRPRRCAGARSRPGRSRARGPRRRRRRAARRRLLPRDLHAPHGRELVGHEDQRVALVDGLHAAPRGCRRAAGACPSGSRRRPRARRAACARRSAACRSCCRGPARRSLPRAGSRSRRARG